MPIRYFFIYCLFLVLFPFSAQAQDQTPLQLVETVQTSLVQVRCVDTKTFTEANGQTRTGNYHSQGSGVIIDSQGLIVTNTHVIASAINGNAPHIYVALSDGTILEAKVVHSSEADFSFIKVDPPYPLTPITWADSSLAPIGTPVVALSNDDGDEQHVLGGAITNLIDGETSNTVELFELNLTLYHGDSGGPLLDNQGHLLGIIMGKKNSEDNKTYAIASSKIQQEYMQYQQELR